MRQDLGLVASLLQQVEAKAVLLLEHEHVHHLLGIDDGLPVVGPQPVSAMSHLLTIL